MFNAQYQRVLLEKQKHNSQRYAVDLRTALKQYVRVLIANMRWDYVPVRWLNYQDSRYAYVQASYENDITDHSSDHSISSE